MQAELPFYEGPEDALKAAIQGLGGAKKVGPMLWPDKTVDNAARLLLDCVNPGRHEKLDYSQLMRVFGLARDAGIHGPFEWFAAQLGYEARPVTNDEQADRIASVIEQATKALATAIPALERLQRVRSA